MSERTQMTDPGAVYANFLSAAGTPTQAMSTVVIGVFTAVTTVVLLLWLSHVGGGRGGSQDDEPR